MIIKTIKNLLKKKLSPHIIHVTGNSNHINIFIVSDIFHNMKELKRQQIIYEPLTPYIQNKTLHAISIKTYSLQEYKQHN
ncbi:MAG: BolA/IbaG family iron-sulfur metabolism protein [Buchnera aphidicola (Chaetogeoica yunlongensis)]